MKGLMRRYNAYYDAGAHAMSKNKREITQFIARSEEKG